MAPLNIAFFGATGGCGLAALKNCLLSGHNCIALARSPQKFTDAFPHGTAPNLTIIEGNAHNAAAVSKCLINPTDPNQLVDAVCFTLGSPMDFKKMSTVDPEVCQKAMSAILQSLRTLRKDGVSGRPRLCVISTTGISKHARDVPLAMMPMYAMLKVPHADKLVMEEQLTTSREDYSIVRPSFLVDGEKPNKVIRVGVEDPVKGVESKAVGYTISREDVGRWMAQNLLLASERKYNGKICMITY